MKKIVSIIILLSILLIALTGCNEYDGNPNQTIFVDYEPPFTVYLSEESIQVMLQDCLTRDKFGLGFGDMKVNYITGVGVEAVVIIYNCDPDGRDRWVEITCRPAKKVEQDKVDGEILGTYEPSPWYRDNGDARICSEDTIGARQYVDQWIYIETPQFLVKSQEAIPVKVIFATPPNIELPDNWAFWIYAKGLVIEPYTQELTEVITEETIPLEIPNEDGTITTIQIPDTMLVVKLHAQLVHNSILDITAMNSTLSSDNLVIESYNPDRMELTITGLTPSATREMSITYNAKLPVQSGYSQIWFIRMME